MTDSIKTLDKNTASLIAAGEVIERPASVVRELLDNAIDAEATEITIDLVQGGIDLIRVKDNGQGMSATDLKLCWKKHTTSKITSIDDLSKIQSLGFRGEALSSIAAVSRMQITSSKQHMAHKLLISHGEFVSFEDLAQETGTSVEVRALFHRLPARKRFLKHASAESSAVRITMQEAALPCPDIEFRLLSKNTLRLFYPSASLLERCAQVFDVAPSVLHLVSCKKEKFSIDLVYSLPDFSRADRKKMWIYVNKRRIRDYRFLQSIEYAYREVLHGGLFPYVALLLTIDPDIVDFNIHPAKKEVRIQYVQEMHHEIVTLLRSVLLQDTKPLHKLQYSLPDTKPYASPKGAAQKVSERIPQAVKFHSHAPYTHEAAPLLFLGQLYKTYLICLYKDNLYLVDQHAAHERKIADQLKAHTVTQKLLVPLDILTSEEESRSLAVQQAHYTQLGIELLQQSPQKWSLVSLPSYLSTMGAMLVDTILELSTQTMNVCEAFIERIACKRAVKSGELLGRSTAVELLSFVFSLENPRCPHGRPLYVHISREELHKRIGRTVH